MSVTSTQTHDGGPVKRAIGRYYDTDTAAAFNIYCGFQPRYVRVVNLTDRVSMEWFQGMTSATGVRKEAGGTFTVVAALGITPLANGFTVGLDTKLNVHTKQLTWIAMG